MKNKSNNTNYSRLLIIGKRPPPIGGVTMHLKRLMEKLQSQKEFEVEVLDYSRVKHPYKIIKKITKAKLIHIHLSNKKIRFILVSLFKLFQKIVIVTFHGKYDFQNYYDRKVLKISDYSIVLNKHTLNNALKYKAENIKLLSAFIPPLEKNILNLEVDIIKNIENLHRADYQFIFSTNASNYVLDNIGEEIYMGTKLLDFFKSNSDYALIFSDPSGNYLKHFQDNKITVPGNVYIINRPHDFVNIIKKSDALIRATTTDGDSLSIKEALFFHVPVFATDIVDRPKGVKLFSNFDNLKKTILKFENSPSKNLIEDGSVKIIELYRELFNA